MSISLENSSLKRKRPNANSTGYNLGNKDQEVLKVVKSKEDMGIWRANLKRETGLTDSDLNKSLKTLIAANLIKEVVNIQSKGRKHYMAVEFEPSSEVSGGAWYSDGNLDKAFINNLKEICKKLLNQNVATVDDLFNRVKHYLNVPLKIEQLSEILKSMVLDNAIMEVKSTGSEEYGSIPFGSTCYKCAPQKEENIPAITSIPCVVCPRISQCTPDGIISPANCVYFKKWLDFRF